MVAFLLVSTWDTFHRSQNLGVCFFRRPASGSFHACWALSTVQVEVSGGWVGGYGGSELELDFTQMVLRMAYVLRRPQCAYIIYPSNITLPDLPLPLPSTPQPQAVYISPELGAK